MVTLRELLIERVAKLGVEHRALPGRDDGFSALCYRGRAFAHFHNENELDIRLTKQIIAREALKHPRNSASHPKRANNSHWIELGFHNAADLDRVVNLVKIAIDGM